MLGPHVLAFISSEKANDVVVLAQVVNHGGVSLVKVDIPFRILPVNRQGRLAQIADNLSKKANTVRDTKAYIKNNVKRWMGVGYAANDDADIRSEIAHYFNCGDQSDAIDFWGYNIYEWCGENTFVGSGYADQVKFFEDYSVPVFFAEYGCNIPNGAAGRIWEETTALYSSNMTGVISGGIVYMYFQEANDYGLVKVSNGAASTMKDYDTLKTKIAAVNPSSTSQDAYNPTNSPAACPDTGSNWAVKGGSLPPTPDKELCDCMFKSLSCVPAKNLNESDEGLTAAILVLSVS